MRKTTANTLTLSLILGLGIYLTSCIKIEENVIKYPNGQVKERYSYYLDENGFIMPLSQNYTARLLVVNGRINEPFATRYTLNFNTLADTLKTKTLLDEIYTLSKYIDQSDFWKAQIEQVYVNKQLEMELIPKVGNHRIVFGEVENIENKFEKLMVFYKKGLSKTGWNEYSEINLKYKNQVVCTKKY